jgi:hypothetical protein
MVPSHLHDSFSNRQTIFWFDYHRVHLSASTLHILFIESFTLLVFIFLSRLKACVQVHDCGMTMSLGFASVFTPINGSSSVVDGVEKQPTDLLNGHKELDRRQENRREERREEQGQQRQTQQREQGPQPGHQSTQDSGPSPDKNMPYESAPTNQRSARSVRSRRIYSKADSQLEALRNRVAWNIDVAYRGTGDLKKKYEPKGGSLNVGREEWDDLWVVQDHIEAWRVVNSDPESSLQARKAALNVVLKDRIWFRNKTQVHGSKAVVENEGDDQASKSNESLENRKARKKLDSIVDPMGTSDAKAQAIDDDDVPLASLLPKKRKMLTVRHFPDVSCRNDFESGHVAPKPSGASHIVSDGHKHRKIVRKDNDRSARSDHTNVAKSTLILKPQSSSSAPAASNPRHSPTASRAVPTRRHPSLANTSAMSNKDIDCDDEIALAPRSPQIQNHRMASRSNFSVVTMESVRNCVQEPLIFSPQSHTTSIFKREPFPTPLPTDSETTGHESTHPPCNHQRFDYGNMPLPARDDVQPQKCPDLWHTFTPVLLPEEPCCISYPDLAPQKHETTTISDDYCDKIHVSTTNDGADMTNNSSLYSTNHPQSQQHETPSHHRSDSREAKIRRIQLQQQQAALELTQIKLQLALDELQASNL